jgi:hypothetical protein
MSNTPASTAFGRLLQQHERQVASQRTLRVSSSRSINAVKAMDAPVLPKVPLALYPTPTPARRPQPVEPFKLDLPFRFDAPVLPKVPLALYPTPTAARWPQPFEPFKLDLPFRFEAALSTTAKQESLWSRLKRWLW